MVYQLNEEQTLFFGGLARFDYMKGGRSVRFPVTFQMKSTSIEQN